MTSPEIIEGLRGCELLVALSDEEVQILASTLADAWEVRTCQAGDHIFDQGEHSSCLYVIVEGQVLLQRTVNIGDKVATWPLGRLGRGRAMGWSAVLYGPRHATASAICQQPGRVICVEGTRLRSLLEERPELGFKVMDKLACLLGERLREVFNTVEAHL